MALENLEGSRIMTGLAASPPAVGDIHEAGGRVRQWIETVEVTAAANILSTYRMARLPSNATILPNSRLHCDDLASSGSPTLDLGVFNLSGQTGITDDDNALLDGLDCATAATSALLTIAIADMGQRLWEYVASQTEDPKADLDITVTLQDAAANTGGTITLELYYVID